MTRCEYEKIPPNLIDAILEALVPSVGFPRSEVLPRSDSQVALTDPIDVSSANRRMSEDAEDANLSAAAASAAIVYAAELWRL